MGFHLSNLLCRFKRTVFFIVVVVVAFFFFSQSFRNRLKKQENLCDIEVYYSHDIGTLTSWSQKRTAIFYLFSFSLKG